MGHHLLVLTVTALYIRIKASCDTGHLVSGRPNLVGPKEAERPCKVGSRRVCRLKYNRSTIMLTRSLKIRIYLQASKDILLNFKTTEWE
jgi:hypothetical protein